MENGTGKKVLERLYTGKTVHWEVCTMGRLYWEDYTEKTVLGRLYWDDCTGKTLLTRVYTGKTVHWEEITGKTVLKIVRGRVYGKDCTLGGLNLERLYKEDSTQGKLHTGRKVLGRHDWKECTLGRLYWKDIWGDNREDNREDIWEDCTKDCTRKSVLGGLYTLHLEDCTGKRILEGLSILRRQYI